MAHEAPLVATGAVDVVHGAHPLTPLIVRAMKLPAAGAQPVMLHVALASAATPATMTWTRRIGIRSLDTRQYAKQGRLVERSGPGAVEFVLRVDDGALLYEQTGCRFLQVPLPCPPAPYVRARVAPTADGWRVEVVVEWRGRLVCRYGGAMRPGLSTS